MGEAVQSKAEVSQLRQRMKAEAKRQKIELQQKVADELQAFKARHFALVKQLVGTGQRKQKVKDMSLGSDAQPIHQETR